MTFLPYFPQFPEFSRSVPSCYAKKTILTFKKPAELKSLCSNKKTILSPLPKKKLITKKSVIPNHPIFSLNNLNLFTPQLLVYLTIYLKYVSITIIICVACQLPCVIYLIFPNNFLKWWILWFPFYRWGKLGTEGKLFAMTDPHIFLFPTWHSKTEFSTPVLLTFEPGYSLLYGAAPCILGCLAISLASTHWMPVTLPPPTPLHPLSYNNQKCLQKLQISLWAQNHTQLRNTGLKESKRFFLASLFYDKAPYTTEPQEITKHQMLLVQGHWVN